MRISSRSEMAQGTSAVGVECISLVLCSPIQTFLPRANNFHTLFLPQLQSKIRSPSSKMFAFVPQSGLSLFSGSNVHRASAVKSLRQRAPGNANSLSALRMVAYPYTGSGYGSAGVPYASDRFGQGFKQTTTSDIVQTVASLSIFSTLVSLLKETGLDYELSKAGPFTLLAPTNDAFTALLEPHSFALLGSLLRPENRTELRKVLSYHVFKGTLSSAVLMSTGKCTRETLSGDNLTLLGCNKKLSAGSARIVKTDLPCSNGVIHILGSVLVPPSFKRQPAGPKPKQFFNSSVLDVYATTVTPRQALGIDPMPKSSSSALVK